MIRNIIENDYDYIITKLNVWWANRDMVDMLPRVFFDHFRGSSFIYEINGKPVGFLVGFISNENKALGYIHFVGVDPEYRKKNVGFSMYQSFIKFCKEHTVTRIQCVTSPKNTASICFHHKLGFKAESYDTNNLPIPVEDYDGPDRDRVVLNLAINT